MAVGYGNKFTVAYLAFPLSADLQHIGVPHMVSMAETVKQFGITHTKLDILLTVSHLEEVKNLPHYQAQLKEAIQVIKVDDRPIDIWDTLAWGILHGTKYLPKERQQRKCVAQGEVEVLERDNPDIRVVWVHPRHIIS